MLNSGSFCLAKHTLPKPPICHAMSCNYTKSPMVGKGYKIPHGGEGYKISQGGEGYKIPQGGGRDGGKNQFDTCKRTTSCIGTN